MDDEIIELVKRAGTDPKILSEVLGGIAVTIGETTKAKQSKFNLDVSAGGYSYKINYSFTRVKEVDKNE